jgi:hypothetical protein
MLRQVAEIATSCQEGFDVLNQALRHDNADDVEAELVTIEACSPQSSPTPTPP